MRFLYLDPGLVDELGHHANFCRAITQELRARGIPTLVFAHREINQKLKAEFKAHSLFRIYTYGQYDWDPVIAFLKSFELASRVTLEDLQRIGGLEPGDIVYMNWAWPAQLMALAQWARSFSATQMPTIVAEVGADPGLEPPAYEAQPGLATIRDPRIDPRALLYRYAALEISPKLADRVRLVAFDRVTSGAFSGLLGKRVSTLPMPYSATTIVRNRARTRPITISVLGHQRPEKGFALMPDVAAGLLHTRTDIRLLIHNAKPDQMAMPQEQLRQLAANDPRILLEETVAGPKLWPSLLERSDLTLCPYDPKIYAFSHSSVACESLANGIPLIVPARTALAAQLGHFGAPGLGFEAFTADAVMTAVSKLLDDFDSYAELAQTAAARWAKTMGPVRTADALLALAST